MVGALESKLDFNVEPLVDWNQREAWRIQSQEPFLAIFELVLHKILKHEVDSGLLITLNRNFVGLRKKYPSFYQSQVARYDGLLQQARDKVFEDDILMSMHEAGVIAGK